MDDEDDAEYAEPFLSFMIPDRLAALSVFADVETAAKELLSSSHSPGVLGYRDNFTAATEESSASSTKSSILDPSDTALSTSE